MKLRSITPVLFAALGLAPASSLAFTNTIQYVNVDQANIYNFHYGAYTGGVYAGSLSIKVNNSATTQDMYCIDLDHDIYPGNSYTVDKVQSATLPHTDVDWFAGNIYSHVAGSVHNADQAAGLQIALWDVTFPNQFTITGMSSTVNDYVTADLGFKNTPGNAMLYKENSGYGQSQVGAVPEPTTVATLAIGAVGILRRRKKS